MGDLGGYGPIILMIMAVVLLALLATVGMRPPEQRRFVRSIADLMRALRGQRVDLAEASKDLTQLIQWDHHEQRSKQLPAWLDAKLAEIRAARGNDSGVALIVRPEDVYWFVHRSGRLDSEGRLDGRIPVWFQRPDTTMEHCTHFVDRGHDELLHCEHYTGPSGRNGEAPAEPRWIVRQHR